MSLLSPAGLPTPRTSGFKRYLPALLLLVIVAGSFFAYRYHTATTLDRSLAQAQSYWDQGNFNHATLTLRRVIAKDPDNAAAFQLLATILESKGIEEAVLFRKKVSLLRPKNRGITAPPGGNRPQISYAGYRQPGIDLARSCKSRGRSLFRIIRRPTQPEQEVQPGNRRLHARITTRS